MGLDSVELVIGVEKTFGIAIPDAVAAEMVTPAMLIAHVQQALGSIDDEKACISLRAFHHIRACLMRSIGVKRSEVLLGTRISSLFSGPRRSERWNSFRVESSLSSLPDLRFGRGWILFPTSVRDLVSIALAEKADELRKTRNWTHEEVRQIIREIIKDQLFLKNFHDSDHFVRDLGLS